jgi:hypothetical protein
MALIGVSGITLHGSQSGGFPCFGFDIRKLESAEVAASAHFQITGVGQLAQWLEVQNRDCKRSRHRAKAEKQIIIDDQVPLLLFAAVRNITQAGRPALGSPSSIIDHRSLQYW